jgi:hypothetical protein
MMDIELIRFQESGNQISVRKPQRGANVCGSVAVIFQMIMPLPVHTVPLFLVLFALVMRCSVCWIF